MVKYNELRTPGKLGLIIPEERQLKTTAVVPPILTAPPSADFMYGFKNWGWYGNDVYNNCFWAALAHVKMVQSILGVNAKKQLIWVKGFKPPAQKVGLAWYEGYLKSQNQTLPGPGTSIYGGLDYMLSSKLVMAAGTVGPNGPNNTFTPELINEAIYDFHAVIVCLALDKQYDQEFNQDKPWGSLDPTPDFSLGHAVAAAMYRPSGRPFITWGTVEGSLETFDNKAIWGFIPVITKNFAQQPDVNIKTLINKWQLQTS